MIEQLFGSKTRVKLLHLFYSNPNRSFYVREITRKVDEQINSVRRELANLLSIGIITSDTTNNRLYYEVNQSYTYYRPLRQIFGISSDGAAMEDGGAIESSQDKQGLSAEFRKLGNVELALLTGQFTRDERAGVDVLIVGDINPTQMSKYVAALERTEGKELRYAVMSHNEFEYRRAINDKFIATVLEAKSQILVDRILRSSDS